MKKINVNSLFSGQHKDIGTSLLKLFLFFPFFLAFICIYAQINIYTVIIITVIVHIVIVTPCLYKLSNIYNWKKELKYTRDNLMTWDSPYFIFDLSLALIYIYSFIFILTILRILSLGTAREFSWLNYIFTQEAIPFFVLIFCYLPYIIHGLLIFIEIKNRLWDKVTYIYYSFHLYFLQNKAYFSICKNITENWFLFRYIGIYTNFEAIKRPLTLKERISRAYTQKKTKWILFFSISFLMILELILTKQLVYIYYLLFILTLIKGILVILMAFDAGSFMFDCCASDLYYNTYLTPKFPQKLYGIYWTKNEPEFVQFSFGYMPDVSSKEEKLISQMQQKYEKTTKKYYPPRDYSGYHNYYNNILNCKKQSLFSPSLLAKAKFRYFHYGWFRFTHTQAAAQITTQVTNNFTNKTTTVILAASTYWQDKAIIVNQSFIHYNQALKTRMGNALLLQDLYTKTLYKQPLNIQTNDFGKFMEYNTLFFFNPLQAMGIYPCLYNKDKHAHSNCYKRQAEPDVILEIDNKNYSLNTVTLDMKTGNQQSVTGANLILPGISDQKYNEIIVSFGYKYGQKYNTDILKIVEPLTESNLTHEEFMFRWAGVVSELNKGKLSNDQQLIPPVRVPKNFNTQELTKEAFESYRHHYLKAQALDNHLNATQRKFGNNHAAIQWHNSKETQDTLASWVD